LYDLRVRGLHNLGSLDLASLGTTCGLSDEDVRRLLDPEDVVSAIERGFGTEYESFVAPVRQHVETRDGVFLSMPCYNRATGRLGVKFVAVAKQALTATVQASYVLFDAASAEPQIFVAANWLTDLRTAAASFLATKFLARKDARVLGIFGTGRQACAHVNVFTALRKFESVLICGASSENSRRFIKNFCRDLDVPAEAVGAEECARRADIICTCTTACTPLFDGRLLRPGTHLNLVGAFQPDCREVDSHTMGRACVVVDTYAGALSEAGDLLIPMREGVIARQQVLADLHEMVTHKKSVRQTSEDITVFKSVGCALEDLAVAELLAAKLEPGK